MKKGHVQKLLEEVNDIIDIGRHQKLVSNLNKEEMFKYYQLYPSCFLRLNDNFLFPLCNSDNQKCPRMISFSLKMAYKLVGRENINQRHLYIIIKKLVKLQDKYEILIPRRPFQLQRRQMFRRRSLYY
jgi:hypothetical protein